MLKPFQLIRMFTFEPFNENHDSASHLQIAPTSFPIGSNPNGKGKRFLTIFILSGPGRARVGVKWTGPGRAQQ